MTIAVIGGGISGLATAFYIEQLRRDSRIVLFEESDDVGGTMRTENVDGFLFERGGNGFLTNKPDTLELVKDCGAESLLLPSSDAARIRYIFTNRLHRLPETPVAFLRSELLGFSDKLRIAAEVFVPPRAATSDETLQSFGYRRVGRAFTDTFLDAMCAGIHASIPERLSVNAAFPLVVQLEQQYGGLFKGMLKKRKRQAGPGGTLMSFRGGMSAFIRHLRSRLRAEVRTGTPVNEVQRAGQRYRLVTHAGTEAFDQVVLATPAYVASRLLRPLDDALADALAKIEYSPIAVVGLGYRTLARPLDGFGLLTTSSAGKEILGVLWDSSIFADRAPPGCKSVRVMIGGQRNPLLALKEEPELIEIACGGVRETMGVTEAPDVTFVKRWERGIPHYRLGHLAVVGRIFARVRELPRFFLNANAYRGVGLNDCVANSRALASRLANGCVLARK